MPNMIMRLLGGGKPAQRVKPFEEIGTSGTAVQGGYVQSVERNQKLQGTNRYKTTSEILANISIVAAGTRYFLDLVAKPSWSVEPADDTDEAKVLADFVEDAMYDMATSWTRITRRTGLYRFHGFCVQEWTAKRRKDGLVGYDDIESRPQHTIERWEIDPRGTVTGMWQTSPQTGQAILLPRQKVIYIVDDTLTDSPEGMGLFRHLVEPAERMKRYLDLEGMGFERDMRGIPVGRVPYTAIRKAVKNGDISQADADKITDVLEKFVRAEAKGQHTGLVLDSQPFMNQTADGLQASAVMQWGVELLTGGATGIEPLGNAINRLAREMATIIGVEGLLIGSDGVGSLALSKDKSNRLYLAVNSTVGDIAEGCEKDFIDPLWILNGFDDDLKPTLKTEDVSFKDVEQIAAVLRDMATAGAVLSADDPAINDMRDLVGISHTPEINPALAGATPRRQTSSANDPAAADTGEMV
jgi:hypothetical protein